MSEAQRATDVPAVFTDTSILYDYTKDEVEAAKTLFEEYPEIEKVTSEFGYTEFKNVAKRRMHACAEWEDAVSEGRDTIGDFSFAELDALTTNDKRSLRSFQQELVRDYDYVEALRLIGEKHRQYKQGLRILFTDIGGEPLVEVLPIDYRNKLYKRLMMDIENASDCQLLSEAAQWYSDGGSDAFVTSDKDDFKGDGGAPTSTNSSELPATLAELGKGVPHQEKINEHIGLVYEDIDHLNVFQIEDFISGE